MEIKIHGGSNIVVPAIDGADLSTPITVFMEPGKRKAQQVMLREDFLKMTEDDTHHKEHTTSEEQPDVFEADEDLYADLPMYPNLG